VTTGRTPAQPLAPSRSTGTPGTREASAATLGDDGAEHALALLQQHQVSQIGPGAISAAERRLQEVLDAVGRGGTANAALLLRQVATDLGVTLEVV